MAETADIVEAIVAAIPTVPVAVARVAALNVQQVLARADGDSIIAEARKFAPTADELVVVRLARDVGSEQMEMLAEQIRDALGDSSARVMILPRGLDVQPDRIEAMARAAYEVERDVDEVPWDQAPEMARDEYRKVARVSIDAAFPGIGGAA